MQSYFHEHKMCYLLKFMKEDMHARGTLFEGIFFNLVKY